jgi:DDE superfamily endonuclease
MDQASIHTSKAFTAKTAAWQGRNCAIFSVPPYAPELNLLESLGRFMKDAWIEVWAYKSWSHMVE